MQFEFAPMPTVGIIWTSTTFLLLVTGAVTSLILRSFSSTCCFVCSSFRGVRVFLLFFRTSEDTPRTPLPSHALLQHSTRAHRAPSTAMIRIDFHPVADTGKPQPNQHQRLHSVSEKQRRQRPVLLLQDLEERFLLRRRSQVQWRSGFAPHIPGTRSSREWSAGLCALPLRRQLPRHAPGRVLYFDFATSFLSANPYRQVRRAVARH
mmetsp:Transcript_22395/g.56595  ORF Transcript_22395/g.56595 Transcript_22395/m.56595 type:complete len:207 (-) Transcript_22395:1477-2097(-)